MYIEGKYDISQDSRHLSYRVIQTTCWISTLMMIFEGKNNILFGIGIDKQNENSKIQRDLTKVMK